MIQLRTAFLLLFLLGVPAIAHAQVAFPPDDAWTPLPCDGAPMFDLFQDQPGATRERDIVGDAVAPAGLRASNATHLFLRMRLDDDPVRGGSLQPHAWGMQFDTNGDLTSYELMVLVDGAAGMVHLFRNSVTTVPNSLDDPADQPAVASYPFAMNARTITAAGSRYGNGDDFFLDFAVPWTDLVPLGLDRTTMTSVWAATSSNTTSLNADVACHDGRTGAPTLDGTASDPTTGDPAQDPNALSGSGQLEGRGGCYTGVGSGSLLLALGFLGLANRRRRGKRDSAQERDRRSRRASS